MKRVLVILSRAPYDGAFLTETLEAAMVAQAFELPTSIVFRNAAIFSLLADHDEKATQVKSTGIKAAHKMVRALPTYEIDKIYVCGQTLAKFGLKEEALALAVEVISDAQLGSLIGQHDLVMNN